jgi:hypothetical protein
MKSPTGFGSFGVKGSKPNDFETKNAGKSASLKTGRYMECGAEASRANLTVALAPLLRETVSPYHPPIERELT